MGTKTHTGLPWSRTGPAASPHRGDHHEPERREAPDRQAGERPCKLTDGKGLFLLVRPSGARVWRVRWHTGHGRAQKKHQIEIGK